MMDAAPHGLKTYLPFLHWLPRYRRDDLPGDLIAGLTVAIMLVPQGMAYALLAGLPPVYGLYAGMLPLFIYGLLGTTQVLTLGPTAITSVMVLSILGGITEPMTEAYIVQSFVLTLALGGVYLLMGLLRMGFIINLLSKPVLVGYVNAAALIILFSQLPALLGIESERPDHPYELIFDLLRGLGGTHLPTVLLSGLCIGVLLLFRGPLGGWLRRIRGLPPVFAFAITRSGPLVTVALAGLLVYALDLSGTVRVIGDVPSGLPLLGLPALDLSHLNTILPGAVAIAFVGFMEGVSTAKSLVTNRRRRLEPNQEMVAMGAANVASAVSGGYAVTTSISRSAVNHAAGARTGLSSLIAALVVTLVAVFLTPLFAYLPNAALAAIIAVSIVNLIDLDVIRRMWFYSHSDTLPFFVTVGVVFFVSIEAGILAGVGVATLIHLGRTSRPRILELGRVNYSDHYAALGEDTTADRIPGVLVVRPDESLYFANAQYLDQYLRNRVATAPDLKHIVLVCSAVNTIDASAYDLLREFISDMDANGIHVRIAEMKPRIMQRIRGIAFTGEGIDESRFYAYAHDAVAATGRLVDEDLPI